MLADHNLACFRQHLKVLSTIDFFKSLIPSLPFFHLFLQVAVHLCFLGRVSVLSELHSKVVIFRPEMSFGVFFLPSSLFILSALRLFDLQLQYHACFFMIPLSFFLFLSYESKVIAVGFFDITRVPSLDVLLRQQVFFITFKCDFHSVLDVDVFKAAVGVNLVWF